MPYFGFKQLQIITRLMNSKYMPNILNSTLTKLNNMYLVENRFKKGKIHRLEYSTNGNSRRICAMQEKSTKLYVVQFSVAYIAQFWSDQFYLQF